ncbi:MAG TPA: FHA domain-containing protein [Steroidobacteraceae bacterium]
MYTRWFKLDQLPFRLRPDPAFLYLARENATTYETMLEAVRGGAGPLCVTGEAGVGKSTLTRSATAGAGAELHVASLLQPHLTREEMYEALFDQFGLPSTAEPPERRRQLLLDFAKQQGGNGKRSLIVADDAHLFTPAALADLAGLSASNRSWNVILVGEPNLAAQLRTAAASSGTEPVNEMEVLPLNLAATEDYVKHRLSIAGASNREIFRADSFGEIYRYTGGIARQVHILCDSALSLAESHSSEKVSVRDILDAVRELKWTEYRAPTTTIMAAPSLAAPGRESPGGDADPTPTLTLRLGDKLISRMRLRTGRLIVGRNSQCDLQIVSAYISRRHCQITTDGVESFVEDLGSANHVLVNGVAVSRCRLKNKDVITLGKHTLIYTRADEKAN